MSHVPLAAHCLTCSGLGDVHQQLAGWRDDKLKLSVKKGAGTMQMQSSCSTAAPRQPELRQGRCDTYHEGDQKQDEIGECGSDSPLQQTFLPPTCRLMSNLRCITEHLLHRQVTGWRSLKLASVCFASP